MFFLWQFQYGSPLSLNIDEQDLILPDKKMKSIEASFHVTKI